ncbi:SGNH/GDSL hydrolase family protein [Blastopirellula marina]|uniref:Lipolytic enzyme n=1 Tax=Blastopirellula marina TaxID=124 RepID=A0A2S8FMX2_9BACT|nr:SGNH/GDSL hydrolase family protein [Blastopirellula marina]PQO33545.1 lipolytic enzyme [Blastopirellula marina]PTL43332.1 lipolytic enzyme [Blastopirellula marina]
MKSAILIVCIATLTLLTPISAAEPGKKPGEASANDQHPLAGKRVVFLGDSITQAGGYVSFVDYFLEKQYPEQDFEIYGLGLASETLSGLSEDGHAGGAFPRPCLFERLGRLLERAKPDVVFACYGINDGIYQPLDKDRFAAFQQGVKKLIAACKEAGVEQIYLVTPPIYDATTKPNEFNYDTVMTEYAAWEKSLEIAGVDVIDLHSVMRSARDARSQPFSKDHVHPGAEGHLLMAKTIFKAISPKGEEIETAPLFTLKEIEADPLYQQVDQLRKYRSSRWMQHVGYTREKTVTPQPLGNTQEVAAKRQAAINQIRRGQQ